MLADERVDIVLPDEVVGEREHARSEPGRVAAADRCAMGLARLDPQAAPSLDQQPQGIALHAILDAEFDEAAVMDADAPEDLLQDAVFVILRVAFPAEAAQAARLCVAGPRQLVFDIFPEFQLARHRPLLPG